MAADDKFCKNYNGDNPRNARVVANRVKGDTTLQCDSLAGWSSETAVHFMTARADDSGNIDNVTITTWKGVVDGDSIVGLVRTGGAADNGNLINDFVKAGLTAASLDDLVSGLLVSLAQDGKLKLGAIIEALNSSDGADGNVLTNSELLGNGIIKAQNLALADRSIAASKIDQTVAESTTKDANTFNKAGVYYIGGTTLDLHYPVASAGYLIVLGNSTSTNVVQFFIRYAYQAAWIRNRNGSTWSDWLQFIKAS
jgi:hypothetical protein